MLHDPVAGIVVVAVAAGALARIVVVPPWLVVGAEESRRRRCTMPQGQDIPRSSPLPCIAKSHKDVVIK